MINFFHRFVNHYSDLTAPLLVLLKKGIRWHWDEAMQTAFERIKEAFLDAVLLHHPLPGVEFHMQTDSSDYGIGAQLFQIDDQGDKRVLSFASRTLKNFER